MHERPLMKATYKNWHTTFPHSGKGIEYHYILEKIIENRKTNWRYFNNQRKRLKHNNPNKTNPPWITALDYGHGKAGTIEWLKTMAPHITVHSDQLLNKYDLVYTGDVLEHIEPHNLSHTIHSLQDLAPVNIHIIDLTPAPHNFYYDPVGAKAHVSILSTSEWQELLESHSHIVDEMKTWRTDDPTYGTRHRLCCLTKKGKRYQQY